MAQDLPEIAMQMGPDDTPEIVIDEVKVFDLDRLLVLAPGLQEAEFAAAYAEIVNHMSHGLDYSVITDPSAFEAEYLAVLDSQPVETPEEYRVDPSDIVLEPAALDEADLGADTGEGSEEVAEPVEADADYAALEAEILAELEAEGDETDADWGAGDEVDEEEAALLAEFGEEAGDDADLEAAADSADDAGAEPEEDAEEDDGAEADDGDEDDDGEDEGDDEEFDGPAQPDPEDIGLPPDDGAYPDQPEDDGSIGDTGSAGSIAEEAASLSITGEPHSPAEDIAANPDPDEPSEEMLIAAAEAEVDAAIAALGAEDLEAQADAAVALLERSGSALADTEDEDAVSDDLDLLDDADDDGAEDAALLASDGELEDLAAAGIDPVQAAIDETGRVPLFAFGRPDFSRITAPRIEGETLVFFARHNGSGLAYEVRLERGGRAAYEPLETVGQ